MDDVKKIIKIYYDNFLDKKYNLHGLILTPKKVEDSYIYWIIENPNDLSFDIQIIREFVYDQFLEYSKYVGEVGDFNKIAKKVCDLEERTPQLNYVERYFNKEDLLKFKSSIKKIKSIVFENISCDIEVDGFFIDGIDDEYFIHFNVKFFNVYDNGILIRDEKTFNKKLKEMFGDDHFSDYTYELFGKFNSIIYLNPLLYDDSYNYIINDIIPFNRDGKQIELF